MVPYTHIRMIECNRGKRINLFDCLEIPKDWVISSSVPDGFWSGVHLLVYPVTIRKLSRLLNTDVYKLYKHWIENYSTKILVLIVPDDESERGFTLSPILIEDLNGRPGDLLRESLQYQLEDPVLSMMKRVAAMILLGITDTN